MIPEFLNSWIPEIFLKKRTEVRQLDQQREHKQKQSETIVLNDTNVFEIRKKTWTDTIIFFPRMYLVENIKLPTVYWGQMKILELHFRITRLRTAWSSYRIKSKCLRTVLRLSRYSDEQKSKNQPVTTQKRFQNCQNVEKLFQKAAETKLPKI